MSPKLALAPVASLLFFVGVCVAGQDLNKPAEQVYKNIQSFKGKPASTIYPAMQFMCASLKVDCDFCHVQDKASDEKREKGTARSMIAMTDAINAQNFGGRNQVTCATCHAGHPHPQAFPPVTGIDVRPRRSQDIKPDEVLAAYSAAIGTDTASKVSSIRFEGTEEADGKSNPASLVVSGNKFLFTAPRTFGYDGTTMWYKAGSASGPIPPSATEDFIYQFTVPLGADTLPKLDNPYGATATIEGKDMVAVSGAMAGEKTRATFYFDKETGLLRQITYLTPTILGSLPTIVDYSDYRKVDGVAIPATISIHSAGGDETRRFKTVKVNGSVDAGMFEMPK